MKTLSRLIVLPRDDALRVSAVTDGPLAFSAITARAASAARLPVSDFGSFFGRSTFLDSIARLWLWGGCPQDRLSDN
jgi:hypothetical protein